MSELQFPKYPIVGQEYDFPPYRYYWDGIKWKTKGIGYNPVNDLRDELEPKVSNNESKVFEALKRSYADAGLNLVEGSFEEGGELLVASDVMITASGAGYSWGGPEFPHNVASGTDPTLPGSGYVPRTDVALRNQLALANGVTLVGGLPFVSPLHFGAVSGALIDATSAIKNAIAKCTSTGWPLDLRGGPWLFSGQLDFSGVSTVLCDYKSELVCNPTGFTAPTVAGRKFAITFGADNSDPHTGRCVGVSIVGSLVVRSANRTTPLDGVFIKGSFINAGHIRAVNFNGYGVYRDSVWDSTFQRISVELCGNTTKHAYWHSSNGDTSNTSNTISLQVERAYHKGFYIDAIRDVVNNIHAERLYQLTANDGSSNIDGSTWLNSSLVLTNSCLKQMICDSAAVNPPTGESIVSGQTYRISVGGINLTADSVVVAGSVLNSYGNEITFNGLQCSDFISNAPASNITLIEPNIITLSAENKITVNGGSVYNMGAQFNASGHSYNNVTIDNVSYSNSIKGDIDFNSCAIRLVGATLNASDTTKMSVEFNNCTIQEFFGTSGHRATVRGGYVHIANIADNSEVWFIDTTIGTFNPLGNVRYITRGVIATTVTSWDYPRTRNYPAGTVTERVGYSASGKLYQNTDGALNWTVLV